MLENNQLSYKFLRRYELNRSKTKYKINKGEFNINIPETLQFKYFCHNFLFICGQFPSDNVSVFFRLKMDEATKAFYCEQSALSRNQKTEFVLIQISEDKQDLTLYWFNDVPPKKDQAQFIKNFLQK